MKKMIIAAMTATSIILGSSNAAWAEDSAANGGRIGIDIAIARKAEETKLAWQYQAAKGRVCTANPDCQTIFSSFKGYAFEGMAEDANNIRRPYNRIALMETANAEGVDGFYTRNEKMIQMKASSSPSYQERGLRKLDEMGYKDGELWTTRGDKAINDPRIKETPISQERLEQASKAQAWAETPLRTMGKAGLIGALFGAGIEGIEQGIDLRNKGRKLTLDDWRKAGIAIASEASYAAISGTAAAGAGILLATAAAPGLVVLIGTAATGFAAYGLAKWGVKKIREIF